MSSIPGKTPIPKPPYTKLAEIYDHVMSHVDYAGWAKYIDRMFRRTGSNVKSILEIACGTGQVGAVLRNMGYEVFGCDLSHQMLRAARSHAKKEHILLPLFAADIRTIRTKRRFDAILCLYDSINYLLTIEEVRTSLERVYDCLRPDGIFIFDICTLFNSRHHFNGYRCKENGNGYRFVRKSHFDEINFLQYNTFTIQFNGLPAPFQEEHVQRIYLIDDVLEAVKSSSFQLFGCFKNTTFRKGSERSERVHFVLVK